MVYFILHISFRGGRKNFHSQNTRDFFLGKGKLYWFQEQYIEVIHHLEILSTSAKPSHSLKRVCSWQIGPYTLMTINPKTRPPPMCPGKKIFGHLLQEMRCRYKLVLQCMSLKDSPRTEPVCSQVDNLQKGRSFVIKHHSVFASPNRPTQGCRV